MGDFEGGDDYWQAVATAANWVVELDARPGSDEVRCVIAPTARTVRGNPAAIRRTFTLRHPNAEAGPFFQARVLIREGAQKGPRDQRAWAQAASGVRVFMEGFRVLPYGEPANDWLALDADYTRRARGSVLLGEGIVMDLPLDEESDKDWALSFLPNRNYYGAVFITQVSGASLRLLVNREGFVPDGAFDGLQKLIRAALDLSTRVRAAASLPQREARRSRRARPRPPVAQLDLALPVTLQTSASKAAVAVTEARGLLAGGDPLGAAAKLGEAQEDIEQLSNAARELSSPEGAMLLVLASVGTQMGSFVHETRSMLGMASSIEGAIAELRADPSLSADAKSRLGKVQTAVGDLRRDLERQAAYLIEVIAPDARRRRLRQSLRQRFDAASRLFERAALKRGIQLINDISEDVVSPPIFPAELTVVFSNLLSNALKAAGDKGKIRAYAERGADGTISFLIENTGVAVNLADAERWFAPFESTTVEDVDPVLGQGMGLGLPITRRVLEEYGGEIRFAPPTSGYATAVKVTLPAE